MAAQALYRKWRSQTFQELIGQEHVVQTLRNALIEDRVAHAYLFTGPRGVGKTSMARLLAKAVNCLAEPAQRPCGVCVACQEIAEGRAVDVIEMDAASHTSVDDARELIERVQFRPTSGRMKVYVIDEVHMLSTAAFNALLKTLEEPPAHALFILATTEVHKVPVTILSRCQRFTFTRLSTSAMVRHIQTIAQQEALTMQPGVAEAIARTATGSLRDALGALEQLAAFTNGQITLAQVQDLLGMSAAAEVDSLIGALLAEDTATALRAVNAVADQGADMRQFTRDLVERLRALLLFVTTGDHTLLDLSADELTTLQDWADQADAARLVHWVRLLSGLDYQLRTSPYGHLPLELAVVEALLAPAPLAAAPARPSRRPTKRPPPPAPAEEPPAPARRAPPAEPAQTRPPPAASAPVEPAPVEPAQTRPPPAAPASAEPAPAEPPPAAREAVSAELSLFARVEAVWRSVVRDVRPRDRMLEAVLRSVRPIDVEGDVVLLLAASPFHREQAEKEHNRRIIEDVLANHLDERVQVRCVIQQADKAATPHLHLHEVRQDPRVRAAINIFSPVDVTLEPHSGSPESPEEEE